METLPAPALPTEALAATMHHLGEVLCAPADVAEDDENVLQPDVFFIAAGRQNLTQGNYVQGAPNLVVEVISVGTVKLDRGDKLKLFERSGASEYWLVDARTRSVEALCERE